MGCFRGYPAKLEKEGRIEEVFRFNKDSLIVDVEIFFRPKRNHPYIVPYCKEILYSHRATMELSGVFGGHLPVQYCTKMESTSLLKTKESKKKFMMDVSKKVV